MQMINHGISTPLLFLCVGVIYDRRHTRQIADYGGLAAVMPKFATVFLIATLASIGLPGLNGFVGEFLVLTGSFGSLSEGGAGSGAEWTWMSTAVVFAGTGVILGAVYMLWAYQRVIFGKVTREENKHLKDLTRPEMTFMMPVIIGCFVLGIWPNIVLEPIENSIDHAYEGTRELWLEAHAPKAPQGCQHRGN